MIHAAFTLEAAAAEPLARTIAGIAVPWNVEGRVSSGDLVVFHPGSLDADARPVVLRDHDRTRTVGRVTAAADDGAALQVSTRISRTALGDESLVLADDRALMFSVGADPTEYAYDADGRLNVYAATWNEISLLPIGAYAGAVVTQVAASQPDPNTETAMTMTDAPDETEPETPDPELPDPEQPDPDEPETRAAPVPITAARGRRQPARNPYADYTLRDVARAIFASKGSGPTSERAVHRDRLLAAQGPIVNGIEAALADITLNVGLDNVAAVSPRFQPELVEIVSWGMPTISALRQGDLERGDYPNKTFNRWITTPIVGTQTAEKTEIVSGPARIGPTSVPVETWAGGNDLSQQLLDFGSATFVEDYIRAAGIDYANKANAYAVNGLLSAATAVTTAIADPFIVVVQKLLAAIPPGVTPPGPLMIAVSYNVGTTLVGVTQQNAPAFWDATIRLNNPIDVSGAGGLLIYVDPALPANTYLAGPRNGATWYDLPGTPFNIRAVNVGLLGLDIAVYGYGALGIQYPGSFVKTTPT